MSGPEERSFLQRGRVRRRVQYLRRLREVELRDLGGFMVELNRFGADRPQLVREKVAAAAATDAELRALEHALGSPEPVRELREAGIGGVMCPLWRHLRKHRPFLFIVRGAGTMSLTSDARSAEPAARPNRLAFGANAVAGPSRDDQEWCFQCGAARTVIHRPPDWRIPAAVVATVVLLVLARSRSR